MDKKELMILANRARKHIVSSIYQAKSGHPGGSLSAAECFVYLFFEEMNIDPARPDWEERDRFVLSKGHTAPGMYAAMAMRGYFPEEEMMTLRHVGSRLQGHPSIQYLPGVDMSTGSLGQGLAVSCGMAEAARVRGMKYRVYTLLGDGELEEGMVWEAAMYAGNRKLDNLCVIVDNNGLQLDGFLKDINPPTPIREKFEAFGFHTIEVADGSDFDQLSEAFAEAKSVKGQPSVIIMKTVKGKGVSYMENSPDWHGKGPNDAEYAVAMDELTKAGDELCRM